MKELGQSQFFLSMLQASISPLFSPRLSPLGPTGADSPPGLWSPTLSSLPHAQLPSQSHPAWPHQCPCYLSSPIAALYLVVPGPSGNPNGTSFPWEMSFHTTSVAALLPPQTCFSLYGQCLQFLIQLNQCPRNVLIVEVTNTWDARFALK